MAEEVRTLVEVCNLRRPTGEDIGCVWRTIRGLPEADDFVGMYSDILDAAGELRNVEPSWVQPELPDEAVDMLTALIEAAKHIVFATCRPVRSGGFAPPSTEQEARHLKEACEEIDKAWMKAGDLGLV